MRTRVTLGDKALSEERLECRCEHAHARSSDADSSRSAAKPSNSGAADRYQYVFAGWRWPRYVERDGKRDSTSSTVPIPLDERRYGEAVPQVVRPGTTRRRARCQTRPAHEPEEADMDVAVEQPSPR